MTHDCKFLGLNIDLANKERTNTEQVPNEYQTNSEQIANNYRRIFVVFVVDFVPFRGAKLRRERGCNRLYNRLEILIFFVGGDGDFEV